jgi:hypothetical protein
MGALPNLSESFRRRFDPKINGELLPADGFPPTRNGLMTPLLPAHMFAVKSISKTAKLDRLGEPTQVWNYELPPMEITAILLNRFDIQGAAPSNNFPYKLRALGRIDVNKIKRGGKGLVSDDFVIVP